MLTPAQVNLFHVFVVGVLAIYLGMKGTKSNQLLLKALPFVAIVGGLYHIYRIYVHWNLFGFTLDMPTLVNLFHIIFVFPTLYYIGRNGGAMSPQLQKALPWLGGAVIAYHLWKYYQRMTSPIRQIFQTAQQGVENIKQNVADMRENIAARPDAVVYMNDC